jgi:hypothetical protein
MRPTLEEDPAPFAVVAGTVIVVIGKEGIPGS